MRDDAERWNEKYAAAPARAAFRPDPLLYAHLPRLRALSRRCGGGALLDLACGRGHNAILGAMCGFAATGIDISSTGLERARDAAAHFGIRVSWLARDLDDHVLPVARYDAVLVFRFLDRRLLPGIAASLRPGGLLLYKTFNRNHLRAHPSFPASFVLEPGELEARFAGFGVIDSSEAPHELAAVTDTTSHLVAAAPDVD